MREELDNNSKIDGAKLQTLPVLTGVIKESMRISSTVPCKLPRVSPPGGLTLDDTFIPAGVIIGVAPYTLHMNEKDGVCMHSLREEKAGEVASFKRFFLVWSYSEVDLSTHVRM